MKKKNFKKNNKKKVCVRRRTAKNVGPFRAGTGKQLCFFTPSSTHARWILYVVSSTSPGEDNILNADRRKKKNSRMISLRYYYLPTLLITRVRFDIVLLLSRSFPFPAPPPPPSDPGSVFIRHRAPIYTTGRKSPETSSDAFEIRRTMWCRVKKKKTYKLKTIRTTLCVRII